MINVILLIILFLIEPIFTFFKIKNTICISNLPKSSFIRLFHYSYELFWVGTVFLPLFVIYDLNTYQPDFFGGRIYNMGKGFYVLYFIAYLTPNVFLIIRNKDFSKAIMKEHF